MSSITSFTASYSCACESLQHQGVGRSESLEDALAKAVIAEAIESLDTQENSEKIEKIVASLMKETGSAAINDNYLQKFRKAHCQEVVFLLDEIAEAIGTLPATAPLSQAREIILTEIIHESALRIQRIAPNYLGNLVYERKQRLAEMARELERRNGTATDPLIDGFVPIKRMSEPFVVVAAAATKK